MSLYTRPRTDTPNEGTDPHGRKYHPPTIEDLERLAPGGSIFWVCEHCDTLNREDADACAECGAEAPSPENTARRTP